MDLRAPWRLLSAGVVLLFFTTNIHCCPSICQCTSKNGQTIVDCSTQNLLYIPPNLPINTTHLDLSSNAIEELATVFQNGTSTNVSKFSHLKNLQSLTLSNNSLASIQGSVFQDLSMLIHLDLSNNKLYNISDEAFTGLGRLSFLSLSGNRELQITNRTFQDLTSLVYLDLSKTGISPEDLSIPVSVENLNLSSNEWNYFNRSIFEKLPGLNKLDLSANNISNIDEHTFPPLNNLQVLNISQNNIKTISPESFRDMTSLRHLILDYNPIQEVTGPIFLPLSSLLYLSLSNMPDLFYLDRKVFSGLTSLSTLQMSMNPKLEYIHIALFSELVNAKAINISNNHLSSLHQVKFQTMKKVNIDIQGNYFPCDCSIEWINELTNNSNIYVIDRAEVGCYDNGKRFSIIDLNLKELHCGSISVSSNTTKLKSPIGGSIILDCNWRGNPPPLVTWITPRGKKLIYYGSHPLVTKSHPSRDDVRNNGTFHVNHTWHNSTSYQSDLIQNLDRTIILSDGSLFIDYMLRSDTGPYTCIVENSRNMSSIEITLHIDQAIISIVKIWSILIGLACAASFFMLNLIYVLISALIRRCINQRRREAILKLVESIDQYKSAQLSRLKDNYYSQLNRIRDGYHNQLERIRDNYTAQATRFKSGASQRREWASQKVDTIRENYNSQVTRLKENSAQKLEQLRETYNNQLFKIRDYGSTQMTRIHKKYKLQQRHVIKLLETMNFDNCRMIIDSECVRTESIIFETDLIHPDLNIPSPDTESDLEYHTASSNNDTPISSLLDLRKVEAECSLTSPETANDSSQANATVFSSQVDDNSASHLCENSSQLNKDEVLKGDNSDEDIVIDEMYDCDEIDQMLIQIQMIDESDDENDNSTTRNAESCV